MRVIGQAEESYVRSLGMVLDKGPSQRVRMHDAGVGRREEEMDQYPDPDKRRKQARISYRPS